MEYNYIHRITGNNTSMAFDVRDLKLITIDKRNNTIGIYISGCEKQVLNIPNSDELLDLYESLVKRKESLSKDIIRFGKVGE